MLSDYLVKLKKIQILSGKLFFFCCLFFCSFQTERPQNSGLFPHFPLQDALQVISRFLPHNPTIYLMEETDILRKKCLDMWPLAHIISSPDLFDMPIDFVWIDLDSIPKILLKNLQQALKTATALYKTESLHSQTQPVFRVLAVASNFSLCSQWYNENQESGSFFLTNPLYDALVRGLSFDPSSYTTPILNALPIYLEQFLSPITTKSSFHSFSPIDCVYMINLDERPEKFSLSCAQLEPYDIHPYRFSAINGWKLSSENINNLGIRLENIPCSNTFIGTVFKKAEDKEYRMHELINKLDTTYFCPGMTRGAIGIILSHLSILQDAYNSNYNIIWVMEDDIQVIKDPRKIPKLLQELSILDPDWDILFTDINTKDKQGNYVPCQGLAMRPNVPIRGLSTFLEKSRYINENFSSIGMRYGAYSMILHRSGIRKILEFYKKHALFLPYDADFWLEPSLRMYHTNTDIVSTIPNALSDNEKPSYKR